MDTSPPFVGRSVTVRNTEHTGTPLVGAPVIAYTQTALVVTLTIGTVEGHGFHVGDLIVVSGMGTPIDTPFDPENQSAAIITAVTTDTLTYSTTVSQSVTQAEDDGRVFGYVYPLEPGLSVIKFQLARTNDPPVAGNAIFHAETWDYHSIRLAWEIPLSLSPLVSAGTLLCVTRSSFGYPMTTEDGVKIAFDAVQNFTGISNSTDQIGDPTVHRPPSQRFASLYDNNLNQGFFYYYSLFLNIQGGWLPIAQQSALTPIDFRARDTMYNLLPDYYRHLDQDSPGVVGNRDLYRYMTVTGFELDYVRTLAQYVEHIYDVDFSPLPLLNAMGVQNFGVALEGGLGDIRYRSMLASINRLYEERGTPVCLEKLVEAASKYETIITPDINMMSLPDDSAFTTALGSWGIPLGVHAGDTINILPTLNAPPWGTSEHATLITDLAVNTTTGFADVTPTWYSPYSSAEGLSKTGMLIKTVGATGTGPQGVMITCGYGTMFHTARRALDTIGPSTSLASTTPALANPYFSGIRCLPDKPYTFSFYMQRLDAVSTPVSVGAGIMWYVAPPAVSNNNEAEQLSAANLVDEDHFLVLGTSPLDTIGTTTVNVTNKALTSNVATLTSNGHPFEVGDTVTVRSVDATFNGTFVLTAKTVNTFSYAKTNANVSSAAATGTASSGGDAWLQRQKYSVVSVAPRFQLPLYAVPYIVLSRADGTGGSPVRRIVSNCMFNIAQQSGILSPSVTPSPTPTGYYLLGPMVLGDTNEFMGGD